MRSVCVPADAKLTVAACDSQYAPFCQPHPDRLVALESVARFTSRPSVAPIGYAAWPFMLASENCTHTASLNLLLAVARSRSQIAYGVSAGALNVTSK